MNPCSKIEDEMRVFNPPETDYERVCELMEARMNEGLAAETNPKAKVKMLPTYVRALPDGSESGNFLALDLGGTNFRVLVITLKGNEVEMKNKIYPISTDIMKGHGDALFDHIVDCIHDFMTEEKMDLAQKTPLGFTFSFPCKQEGLDVGRLITWTKGFQCAGVEGEDVVDLLHQAIRRKRGMNVECVAILNDTVGCLMSCAFSDHDTLVGVILGTGTNACYMEQLDNVEIWGADRDPPEQVIINTEWGAFGDDGCLDFVRTAEDKAIDNTSVNPGKQQFEKMISGMYMGEIARQCIARAARNGHLFKGQMPSKLMEANSFFTKYVSEIETDEEGGTFEHTRGVLEELDLENVTLEDCRNVQYICAAVSRRAAYLASAGIATILRRLRRPKVTVAVDGSLFRFHPHFKDLMVQKIRQLAPGTEFQLMLSEDGSGKGAALVAAVAARLKYQ